MKHTSPNPASSSFRCFDSHSLPQFPLCSVNLVSVTPHSTETPCGGFQDHVCRMPPHAMKSELGAKEPQDCPSGLICSSPFGTNYLLPVCSPWTLVVSFPLFLLPPQSPGILYLVSPLFIGDVNPVFWWILE